MFKKIFNSFLLFKSSNTSQRSFIENLHLAHEIFGINATLSKWLLSKETSVNKFCKLTQFIYTNYWLSIHKRKKIDRPKVDEVCLPANDLSLYFRRN